MQLPLISGVRELHPAPRQFLFFTAFNVISWQCIVGPALVLVARKIDMPASWVGLLISMLPFSTMLVVGTVPLVARLGPKRLMASTWFLRNMIICPVFLMPWVMRGGNVQAGWYVLLIATLGFCLMRAIGSGGWFPWLHEVVPEEQRGIYFSTEAATTQLVNVVIILGQGALLIGNPGVGRFLIIYAFGIGAGLFSLIWMWRVPGGEGIEDQASFHESLAAYRVVFSDRRYLAFVATASLCFSAASWFGSAYVLYLRDVLQLTENSIMILLAAGSTGVLLTIRFWGRFADYSGSGRAMFKTLTGHSLMALGFMTLLPGERWTPYLLPVLAVLVSIFGSAFWMAAHRAMLNRVQNEGRVAYTTVWTVGTALMLGLTPILTGQVISHGGLWGFRACFLIAGLFGLACAVASELVVGDGQHPAWSPSGLLNPTLPLRTLARIVWITVGMHESNR